MVGRRINKKGFIQDHMYIGFFVVVLAISVLLGSMVMSNIYKSWLNVNNTRTHTALSTDIMKNSADRFSKVFDYLFLFVFVMAFFAIFVSMFFIDAHPAMFFVIVIILVIILFVLAIFNNVFHSATQQGALAQEKAKFSVMSYVFDHWMVIMTLFGFVSIILLFAKLREGWFR